MTVNGLNIAPQISALPVQLGTMVDFAGAQSASQLAHAWKGVESRVWPHVREQDRYDVGFPADGSESLGYARFRDKVVDRASYYMDRRVEEAHALFREHGNFRRIGVEDPLKFAQLLVEAKGYGIVSRGVADGMLMSAARVFGDRGIDISASKLVAEEVKAVVRQRFESQTRSRDVSFRPRRRETSLDAARAALIDHRKAVGAVAGTAGVVSFAVGAYMLSIAAPGILFIMLGLAGFIYGISTFVSNPRRPE